MCISRSKKILFQYYLKSVYFYTERNNCQILFLSLICMLYRWKKNQERLAISLKDAFIPGEKVNYIVKDFSIVLAEIKYLF